MSPFQKNLQKFLVFSFTMISITLVIVGTLRAKKNANEIVATPNQGGTNQGTATTSLSIDTTGALTFSGSVYQTPWGNASASIKVKDGHVVAVTMPQVPNSPPSQYAEQYLIEQALTLGSADIQGVSGATYTSLAFKSSLENALAQAKTQGQTIVGGTGSVTTTPKPTVPRNHRDDDDENENGWWDK